MTGLPVPARDEAIWEWAKMQSDLILIVSNDEDFERLSRLRGFPPKVVLLRTGNQSSIFIESLIRKHRAAILELAESTEYGILEIHD